VKVVQFNNKKTTQALASFSKQMNHAASTRRDKYKTWRFSNKGFICCAPRMNAKGELSTRVESWCGYCGTSKTCPLGKCYYACTREGGVSYLVRFDDGTFAFCEANIGGFPVVHSDHIKFEVRNLLDLKAHLPRMTGFEFTEGTAKDNVRRAHEAEDVRCRGYFDPAVLDWAFVPRHIHDDPAALQAFKAEIAMREGGPTI
jgi:hypothetical protein